MNARHRNLLAIALGAALASPLAMAQVGVKVGGGARAQVGVTTPQTRLPQRAVENTTRAVERTAERGRAATRQAIERATEAATTEAEVGVDANANANANANSNANANAAAHSEVGMRQAWAALDVDGDGRISLAEAAVDAAWADSFGRLDADGDGFISEAEYRAHAHADHVVDATVEGAANAAAHSAVAVRGLWAELDADADGRVSLPEAAANAGFQGSFSAMDADGDGFVTEAEYRTYAQARLKP